jgi:cysteine desulfurase/selenocysteine lyase
VDAQLDWTTRTPRDGAGAARDGRLQKIDGTQLFGPASLQNRYPVVSFQLDGVHPHDVAQTLDFVRRGGARRPPLRQPLMDRFDLDGTTRVSIAPYNDNTDIDALLTGVRHAAKTLR